VTLPELQAIAERINTGTANSDTSRALIVFNLTDTPVSGVAVFRASMSWPHRQPLPPVDVSDRNGTVVPAAIREMTDGPDAKGRADRRQISFALHFAAADVPANGWRTYVAFYADTPSPPLENGAQIADLLVVETTRHGGDLPSTGNF